MSDEAADGCFAGNRTNENPEKIPGILRKLYIISKEINEEIRDTVYVQPRQFTEWCIV